MLACGAQGFRRVHHQVFGRLQEPLNVRDILFRSDHARLDVSFEGGFLELE